MDRNKKCEKSLQNGENLRQTDDSPTLTLHWEEIVDSRRDFRILGFWGKNREEEGDPLGKRREK
jgi:hypothetical protein